MDKLSNVLMLLGFVMGAATVSGKADKVVEITTEIVKTPNSYSMAVIIGILMIVSASVTNKYGKFTVNSMAFLIGLSFIYQNRALFGTNEEVQNG